MPTQRTAIPLYRHTEKRAVEATAVPRPQDVTPTSDYWYKEGNFWKRVHIQPRTAYYIPEQTDDGPDISRLTAWRQTLVTRPDGQTGFMEQDTWRQRPKKVLDFQWTGSTNFEEQAEYKATYESDDDGQKAAKPARGVPQPKQPTAQERAEHELTHLPYRSWCETCVRTKGRADNHKRQTSKRPVVQVDITYIKSINEKDNTPILTAVDVETGMCMATLVRDRTQHFEYLVNCLQSFLMDTGRAQATLANTVLQSDQEQFLINLLKATALRLGGNITVRQAPAYSSQSQGSVERLHRTLVGQIRTLRAQLQNRSATGALDGQACGIPPQQVPSTQRWQHQLLQTLEQRAQNTAMHLWRNSTVHDTNNKSTTETRATVLQGYLAGQGYSNKRTHHRHHQQGYPSKNSETTHLTRQL